MEILKEIFGTILGLVKGEETPEEYKIEKCTLGFYNELEGYKYLKPRGFETTTWNLKKTRPLKVVDVVGNTVLVVLTSTKSGFGCPNEALIGIDEESSRLDFSGCKGNDRCQWILNKRESYLFKRPHKGYCYVWSMSKPVFEKYATLCGKCNNSPFSPPVERAITHEVQRFKNFLDRMRRKR